MVRADLSAHLDAARSSSPVPEPHVEHRDIRLGLRDQLERILGGSSFADHRDVVLARQDVADPSAHQLVVIEQEHADRHHASVTRK